MPNMEDEYNKMGPENRRAKPPELENLHKPHFTNELVASRQLSEVGGTGARNVPDRVPGMNPNETWASWMLSSTVEYDSFSSEKARRFARDVAKRPEAINTIDTLTKDYLRLEEMARESFIGPTDADVLMLKIQERIEALELKASSQPPNVNASPNAVNQFLPDFVDRLTQIENNLGQYAQAMGSSLDQVAMSQAAMSAEYRNRLTPEEERARWIYQVYVVDFYARFQPGQEPGFYARMNEEQRHMQNIQWEIAKGRYVKRRLASKPHEYVNNEELNDLTKQDVEKVVEQVPGVHKMLEAYVDAFDGKFKLTKADGTEMTFWDISSIKDLEEFRSKMRSEYILDETRFVSAFPHLQVQETDNATVKQDKKNKLLLEARLADSLALDLLEIGLTPESLDSRYADSASKGTSNLPGLLVANSYKAVLHPQEKWESKSMGLDPWGAFGFWGVKQFETIKKKYPHDKLIVDVASSPSDYWRTEVVGDERKVYVPEIYPVVTFKSFFEYATDKDKVSILDRLRRKEPIRWKEIKEDSWASWNTGKFSKAVEALEFWKNPQKLDTRIKGYGLIWAHTLKTVTDVTLGMLEEVDKLREKKSKSNDGRRRTYQNRHNLKVAPIFAQYGGVKDITKKIPDFPADFQTRMILGALKDRTIQYLDGHESLRFE